MKIFERKYELRTGAIHAALLAIFVIGAAAQSAPSKTGESVQVPVYQVDPAWPKPLPNNWTVGPVCGVAVDQHGNIWIVQRSQSPIPSAGPVQPNAQRAPEVLEFTQDGTLLASWGGPGAGYEWPKEVHGIYVDLHDNVWIGGANLVDNQILKFTTQGKFLFQIGHAGKSQGSNDTANLGGPAQMFVDEPASELYVADGYINHRIIVFDATTGAYKRHWGAYGKRPDDSYYTQLGIKPGQHTTNERKASVADAPPPPQFDLVHCAHLSNDGFVYVCDRSHNRIQVFKKDGTFVQEGFLGNDVLGSGAVSDIGFSTDPGQRFAFVLDSTKQHVYIIDRKSLKLLSTFGDIGRQPGQFMVAHNIAVDSKGDLFITDSMGARVQKFVQTGTQASAQ